MKKTFFIFLVIFWIMFIFYNSLQPATQSSEASGRIVSFVSKCLENIKINVEYNTLSLIIRKLAHMFEFFILFLFVITLLKEFKFIKGMYILSISFCIIIALIDEGIQYFIDGRSSSLIDVSIDTLGSIIGIVVYYILNIIIIHKKYKRTLNNI